jgi:uncharacterized protein YggE
MACFCFAGANAHAQSPQQSTGTLVVVSGVGEVKRANDQVRMTLMIEEQDKDKAIAASRVNQKMKQGMGIVRKEDPDATLKTRGYYTYPIYQDDRTRADSRQKPLIVGWRVGQYLDVTTKNLGGLPKTVAATQSVLALNALNFDLSEETVKDLDKRGIEAAYRNLTERVGAIAKAMGRNTADAMYEAIDFEGNGSRIPQVQTYAAKSMVASNAEAVQVEEPSFEPGDTVLTTRVVGKVRFK